jgi:ABC-2 type transport system permease protein
MATLLKPRGGLPGAVAAEWTKLWSVRSTWFALGAAALVAAGYALLYSVANSTPPASGVNAPANPSAVVAAATAVTLMAQLVTITLAALVIAAEYSTRSISTTLQFVPARARVVLAKGAVTLLVLAVAGAVLFLLAYGIAEAVLGDLTAPVGAGQVLGAALAAGAYLGLSSLVVIGAGAVVRSVAGTIAFSIVLLMILPMALQASGVRVLALLAEYLPGPAGMVLLGTAEFDTYGPGTAVVVLLAWAAAGLQAGSAALRARDA